jgi:hypothetical protein
VSTRKFAHFAPAGAPACTLFATNNTNDGAGVSQGSLSSGCYGSGAFCLLRRAGVRRLQRQRLQERAGHRRDLPRRELHQLEPELLTKHGGGLFILPYVLFSGMAGQLADRFDKTLVLKAVKAAEIVIMTIARSGFAAHSIEVLLSALFLMGMHSTFFAPAKYGLLPEVLEKRSWSAATRWSRWARFSRFCSARSRPACWQRKAASAQSQLR